MTLLAVAPRKFFRGVEAPGTRLGGKYRTPSCALGAPATYDWRAPEGSPENTAHIEPVHSIVHHDDLLGEEYDSDAHFVTYVLRRGGLDGTPDPYQPRVNKGGRAWVESIGYTLSVETLVADVDNMVSLPGEPKPVHSPWRSLAVGVEAAGRVHRELRTAAVYVTARGLRIVQPLTSRVGAPDIETSLRIWLAVLEERLAPLGLRPDWECDDWTRVFRAPHVLRHDPGKAPYQYHSPAVLRTCDPIPPPAGFARPRVSKARRRTPLPGAVVIDRALDPTWRPVADALSRAFAGGWRGERHTIGLSLAGALLWSRVPREQVPALVAEVARASAWDVEHHRGSAVDTVQRWSDGYGVSGRSALPDGIQEALDFALGRRRAILEAAPAAPPSADLAETTRLLRGVLLDAPIGLTVIKAQCGLGKTMSARAVASIRAAREGKKLNRKTAFALPTTELCEQVTADLRAAGVKVTRLFGPLSVRTGGRPECHLHAPAAALAVGGQSVHKLYCGTCERQNTCTATSGQDAEDEARVFVGPHRLLAELVEAAGAEGLVFIDEAPTTLEDLVFPLDALIAAEPAIAQGHFERAYSDVMAPILRAVRAWVEVAPPEETGSIDRALALAGLERPAVAGLGEVPPLDRYSVVAARSVFPLAQRLGEASQILRALWRALVRPGVRLTAYDRGGRSLAVTALDLDVENAILGANRDGEAIARRVVIASADAHLRLDEYRAIAPDLAFHDFAAPDGAPIHRVHLVVNGSRARLATDDPGPIQIAARLVAEWALEEPAVASCGVVTFKRHEQTVLQALESSAPSVRWEVAHYGAVRGLDRWKDFDAVATIGDPRPNLDAVARELGGGGAEVEARYERADAHARSELEQAHGRLRTVHRTRPGKALHVGALLPLGWPGDVEFRKPVEGRLRRPAVPGLAEMIEAAGGQSAAARACGRARRAIQQWLSGEGRPQAEDVDALRRAGTERRLMGDESTRYKRPLGDQRQIHSGPVLNDSTSSEQSAAE